MIALIKRIIAEHRLQRALDARKLKAYRELEASIARNLAAQEREDRRALRRLAQMRGRGLQRLRGVA